MVNIRVGGGSPPPPMRAPCCKSVHWRPRDTANLFQAEALAGYSAGHLLHVRGRTLMAQPSTCAPPHHERRVPGHRQPRSRRLSVRGGQRNGRTGPSRTCRERLADYGFDVAGPQRQGAGQRARTRVYNKPVAQSDERRLAVDLRHGIAPTETSGSSSWLAACRRASPSIRHRTAAADGRLTAPYRDTSSRRGPYIFTLSSTQPGTERQLFESKTSTYTPSWSHDGRHLVFTNASGPARDTMCGSCRTAGDPQAVRVRADTRAGRQSRVFRPTAAGSRNRRPSRAARRCTSGRFRGREAVYQVSRAGGTQPHGAVTATSCSFSHWTAC
jgi:hypothetical protein